MMATQRTTPIEILLVEDNPVRRRLTQGLFKDAKVDQQPVRGVGTARRRCDVPRREGEHRDAPRPDLILLDLNLPRKDGREVLREIKQSPIPSCGESRSSCSRHRSSSATSSPPTSSTRTAYIAKPIDLDQFASVVNAIEEFWLSAVRLPEAH